MNRNHHASHLAYHHARRAAHVLPDGDATQLDLNVLIPADKDVSGPAKSLHARDASPVIAARSESGCSSSKDSDTCQKPTDSSTAIILAAMYA